ncbi:PapD-like protein [Absidia repens]|uniref:PapD-like protein n=1 Tax=Absidia repens TaxID=90262 RepID=A0A1X2ITB5_9FUNG|nr:PapD-like protein [Absidia repens]
MSVQLEPSEILTFKRPLTRMSKETLIVRNPTKENIAFKVKTTAPKLYCVRPNAGIVAAGKSQEVQVMLQPFKEEPPLDQKCKDKFLVQTVPLVDDIKDLELAELWPHVETKARFLIQQIKLRCSYFSEEAEKEIDNVTLVDSVMAPEEIAHIEPTPRVDEVPKSSSMDEMAKMRSELDAYRNELESLRSRAPDAAFESHITKSNGISLPLVVIIALLSFLVSFILLKQVI